VYGDDGKERGKLELDLSKEQKLQLSASDVLAGELKTDR
jgi:hypothetical protein